jgi:hypothetical protein
MKKILLGLLSLSLVVGCRAGNDFSANLFAQDYQPMISEIPAPPNNSSIPVPQPPGMTSVPSQPGLDLDAFLPEPVRGDRWDYQLDYSKSVNLDLLKKVKDIPIKMNIAIDDVYNYQVTGWINGRPFRESREMFWFRATDEMFGVRGQPTTNEQYCPGITSDRDFCDFDVKVPAGNFKAKMLMNANFFHPIYPGMALDPGETMTTYYVHKKLGILKFLIRMKIENSYCDPGGSPCYHIPAEIQMVYQLSTIQK